MTKGGIIKENTIRKPKLLIVEGNHERDFFESWLKFLGIDDIHPLLDPVVVYIRFVGTHKEYDQIDAEKI